MLPFFVQTNVGLFSSVAQYMSLPRCSCIVRTVVLYPRQRGLAAFLQKAAGDDSVDGEWSASNGFVWGYVVNFLSDAFSLAPAPGTSSSSPLLRILPSLERIADSSVMLDVSAAFETISFLAAHGQHSPLLIDPHVALLCTRSRLHGKQ